ncbi:ParB/RepB/Spo0J family partition protein [Tenggerimyces flavus]|uniref:ParB N-terminal domain-containing protein n=1 Tax=Tenggerimyces flavus TaxID=1708749 RepID=A0ABV7YLI7_9ACTN|nr:ParB/RepB/Spo0J family partition protein [Tenggerimyces flavus]MBM7790183.1 ParB-like chromosome segregation protein Spo0J [Tenggerimyces flavus]
MEPGGRSAELESGTYDALLDGVIASVPVEALVTGLSTRVNGTSDDHVRLLADSTAVLPPIIVQRSTMRVIDGMHRLRAAVLRGHPHIAVRFYDGPDRDVVVVAVQANVAHGLPLSLADRTAAAEQIMGTHPEWSDRRIAVTTGLAPRTVTTIRLRINDGETMTSRLGRDGRVRPLDSAARRRAAESLLAASPHASLREVAREAGVAPSTVKLVRERMRAGLDAVTDHQRRQLDRRGQVTPPENQPPENGNLRAERRTTTVDRQSALQSLRKDPSLRFNDAGRALLQWLDAVPIDPDKVRRVVGNVPEHWLDTVIALARENSRAWQDLIQQLERQQETSAKPSPPSSTPRSAS